MYVSEDQLIDSFVARLMESATPWGAVQVTREFYYNRGRTDVVALTSSGNVVAFEGKLSRWRDALHQAYRNLCFAHSSYVLLPRKAALWASRFEQEFVRRRVGLCYIEDDDQLVVLVDAPTTEPLQPWLSNRATLTASGAESGVAQS